jgi:hypothetical protein
MNMATHAPELQVAEHHRRASDSYAACAHHHRLAAVAWERGDLDAADHHCQQAIEYRDEAMQHEERARYLHEQASMGGTGSSPHIELESPLAGVR